MGNGSTAAETLTQAIAEYSEALQAGRALALAQEIHTARVDAEDTSNTHTTGFALARAALLDGSFRLAMEEGRRLSLALSEAGDPGGAQAAAWIQGEAAWRLGLDEEMLEKYGLMFSYSSTQADSFGEEFQRPDA